MLAVYNRYRRLPLHTLKFVKVQEQKNKTLMLDNVSLQENYGDYKCYLTEKDDDGYISLHYAASHGAYKVSHVLEEDIVMLCTRNG